MGPCKKASCADFVVIFQVITPKLGMHADSIYVKQCPCTVKSSNTCMKVHPLSPSNVGGTALNTHTHTQTGCVFFMDQNLTLLEDEGGGGEFFTSVWAWQTSLDFD